MVLEASSKNSTLTWVTPPLEPVLPKTLITLAKVTGVLASYKKMTNVNICCSSREVSLQKTYHFDVLLNVICIVRKEKKKEEEKRNRRNLVL